MNVNNSLFACLFLSCLLSAPSYALDLSASCHAIDSNTGDLVEQGATLEVRKNLGSLRKIIFNSEDGMSSRGIFKRLRQPSCRKGLSLWYSSKAGLGVVIDHQSRSTRAYDSIPDPVFATLVKGESIQFDQSGCWRIEDTSVNIKMVCDESILSWIGRIARSMGND